jgi:hypothetical protein
MNLWMKTQMLLLLLPELLLELLSALPAFAPPQSFLKALV